MFRTKTLPKALPIAFSAVDSYHLSSGPDTSTTDRVAAIDNNILANRKKISENNDKIGEIYKETMRLYDVAYNQCDFSGTGPQTDECFNTLDKGREQVLFLLQQADDVTTRLRPADTGIKLNDDRINIMKLVFEWFDSVAARVRSEGGRKRRPRKTRQRHKKYRRTSRKYKASSRKKMKL